MPFHYDQLFLFSALFSFIPLLKEATSPAISRVVCHGVGSCHPQLLSGPRLCASPGHCCSSNMGAWLTSVWSWESWNFSDSFRNRSAPFWLELLSQKMQAWNCQWPHCPLGREATESRAKRWRDAHFGTIVLDGSRTNYRVLKLVSTVHSTFPTRLQRLLPTLIHTHNQR